MLNVCGQHLDGRHEQFLSSIIKTLETQTAKNFASEKAADKMDEDVVENGDMECVGVDGCVGDDPDAMSDEAIVQLLSKKSKTELMDPKLAPYVTKIKHSPDLLKALQEMFT